MQDWVFPKDERDLTPELLTAVLSVDRPDVVVEALDIVEAIQSASGRASTADRVILDLDYRSGTAPDDLPRRVVLKTMLVAPIAPPVMYETEVRFYREIRPTVPFEAPIFFGALFDHASGHFGILLEDLRERGAVFANVTVEVSLDRVRTLITHLAALHAKYWESPALEAEFSWMATPAGGGMEKFFRHVLPRIEAHLDADPWRLEILEPIGRSVPELHADMVRIAAGPLEHGQRTLLHGDTHVGNTYLLEEGRMGWLDFQLSLRGCYARDLTYLITTALPIEQRRAHERELIAFYFDELQSRGVTSVPDMETAWTLHRQAAFWGLVIGWLTCPTPNYGREITEENLRRLTQILIDLDCLKVVPE